MCFTFYTINAVKTQQLYGKIEAMGKREDNDD
jgi:hypothetical protein